MTWLLQEQFLSIGFATGQTFTTAMMGQIYIPVSGEFGLKMARVFRPTSEQLRTMILEIRRKKGLSRSLLAAIMGVSRHSLRRWDDGSRKPCASAKKSIWLLHAVFLDPQQFANLENIVLWGNGPKTFVEIER